MPFTDNQNPASVYDNLQKASELEFSTGVDTPADIVNLPKIDFEQALDVGVSLGLDQPFRNGRYKYNPNSPEVDYFTAEAVLRLCRQKGMDVQNLAALSNGDILKSYTLEEIAKMFNTENSGERLILEKSEIIRRKERDENLLKVELSILRKAGVVIPEFADLEGYCSWLSNFNNKQKKLEGTWGLTPSDVYWNLMTHYYEIFMGAERSFDPLRDWELYLRNDMDPKYLESWEIPEGAENDITFYTKLFTKGYIKSLTDSADLPGTLLTHTIPLSKMHGVLDRKILRPRVCYSNQHIVSRGKADEIVLLFDKSQMDRTYNPKRFLEEGSAEEAEIRSGEPNNIGFCLGVRPINDFLSEKAVGNGVGTGVYNPEYLRRLTEDYAQTGNLN